MSYQLQASAEIDSATRPYIVVLRTSDQTYIPLDNSNADCIKFIWDWIAGILVDDPVPAPFPYSLANLALLRLVLPSEPPLP